MAGRLPAQQNREVDRTEISRPTDTGGSVAFRDAAGNPPLCYYMITLTSYDNFHETSFSDYQQFTCQLIIYLYCILINHIISMNYKPLTENLNASKLNNS